MVELKFKGETGFLSKYLRKQFNDYIEPTRKGTPKGEPIGFSKIKFGAVLLSLTSIDLKKQAAMLNVSYGLLRKWRTEEQFSKEVYWHTQTFIDVLLNHLDSRAEEKWSYINEDYPWEEAEFYKKIIDPELKEHFSDIKLYSSNLILAIYERLSDVPLMKLDKFLVFRFYFILFISESFVKTASIHTDRDVLDTKKTVFNKLKGMVIYYLRKARLSDEMMILQKFLSLLPGYVGI